MDDTALPGLHCQLLGTPSIVWQRDTWDISRKQVRALFYCLAIRPRPLSRDQLAFLFWPDTSTAEARRQFTRLLTHLRRALPSPGMVIVEGSSVRLDFQQITSDTFQFESMRAANDLAMLEMALKTCRGPFLDGFSLPDCPEFEAWVENERRWYARSYIELASNLVEHCVDSGFLEKAIAHARQVLECDDLVETMHRRLIELYGLVGDRRSAQRQYEQCAAILQRELGVSPLPDTLRAYQFVMRGEMITPFQGSCRSGQPVSLHPDLPLIGREFPLQMLRDVFQKMLTSQGLLALIVGEAGIGKTRLAETFLGEIDRKCAMVKLTAMRPNRGLAFHLVAAFLRQTLSQHHLADKVEPVWLAETARLLPELHRLVNDLPPTPPTEPAEARTRLFEALTQCILALCEEPFVLFLDDLHWADPASLEWLASLAERLRQRPILLLATAQLGEEEYLRPLIWAYRGSQRWVEIPLSGLQLADLQRVIANIPAMRQANPVLIERIQHTTGGNPFFLSETLNLLRERQMVDPMQSNVNAVPLPDSIRAAVRQRLEPLDPSARQVLEALAVLNRPASFDQINHTAGRDELETCAALDVLIARKLIAEQEGCFVFCHACIREVVENDLSHWRKSLLQRRGGEIL